VTDIVDRLRTVDISWSQEGEWCAEAADEIKRLRLANSDLQMNYDYARTECDKLQTEVLRLRGSLSFISIISMLTPLDDQSWQSHAKFINAYALDELKEKE